MPRSMYENVCTYVDMYVRTYTYAGVTLTQIFAYIGTKI